MDSDFWLYWFFETAPYFLAMALCLLLLSALVYVLWSIRDRGKINGIDREGGA